MSLQVSFWVSFWRTFRAWWVEPEFRLVQTLYYCQKLAQRGGLARLWSRLLWRKFIIEAGCMIAPEARIGPCLKLPHAIGIVVSEDAEIGADVTLYQNVTVGRRVASEAGAPRIEDGVILYAGAVVIGPVVIGRGAVIGANAVVLTDVPEGAVYGGIPAREIGRSNWA